jgi:hypothetical protein
MFVIMLLKMVTVLRWSVGGTILAAAWLLKEDEEGRVTNWLEEKRKAAAARRDQTLSRAAIYIQSLASVVTDLLTTVFGKRLVSIHAIFVSGLLSLVSIISVIVVMEIFTGPHDDTGGPYMRYILASLALVLLASTIACIRYSSSKIAKILERILLAGVIVSYIGGYIWILSHSHHLDDIVSYSLIMLGSVLSIGIDISFIMVMRWVFQRADAANGIRAVLLLLLVTTSLLAIIIVGTVSLTLYIRHTNMTMSETFYMPHTFGVRDVVLDLAEVTSFAGASCVFNILLSCSILIICLVITFNALVWTFVDRNIYSFNRHKLLTNKRLLWSAGIAICSEPHLWNLAVRAVKAGWL